MQAIPVSRKLIPLRLSTPSPGGNVLAAMDRSAAALAIPADRPRKAPRRVGPSMIQKLGATLGKIAKQTNTVVERSVEGFD